MCKDTIERFHGELYYEGPWNCTTASECRMCKTKNPKGNKRHWARQLCRSCYRRLSLAHRLYNDQWSAKQAHPDADVSAGAKKSYKSLDPAGITFSDVDIETLLERYDFKCAYCKKSLQDHSPLQRNAFQLEILLEDNKTMLVPICRACNCSKKNLASEEELRKWARTKRIQFPFTLIPSPDGDRVTQIPLKGEPEGEDPIS